MRMTMLRAIHVIALILSCSVSLSKKLKLFALVCTLKSKIQSHYFAVFCDVQ